MATRTYPHLQAPSYSPGATYKGHWEDVVAVITRAFGPSKPDMRQPYATATVARAETSTSGVYDVCLVRLVSPPIDANVTIDGSITLLARGRENNAAADHLVHAHVWVSQGDSTTVRGTLVTDYDGVEFDTNIGICVAYLNALAVTSVAAQAGDRIIIELGYRATNTSSTSYTTTLSLTAAENLADAADGENQAADNIATCFWVEFSNDITFRSDIRVTQVSLEAAIQDASSSDTPTNLSQMLVEAALVPTPPTRLSQMVIEVILLPPAPITGVIWNPLAVRCQASYYVNLYDTSGHLLAVFDDFKPLTIEHKINSFSNCTFSIDGLDSRINLFGLDYILEVWRDIGDVKYIEFEGLHRSDQLQYTEGGHWIYTSYSRSFEDFLMRRCVLYRNLAKVLNPDGITYHGYTLKRTYADDVMKEFVNENIGPGANNHVVGDSNTRLVNGTMPGFNVQAVASLGPNYFANFSYRNLYEVLQEIAEATGVDFKVRRYSGNQFEFQTFYPQLGTDKSSTLIFAPEYGNMTVPSYIKSRTEEVNVVAILGKGENTHRNALTFERASTLDSPWNRRETTHDSRNDTGQGFIDTSVEVLNNLKAKEAFTFKVMQTDASAYGYDYVLGDVCTVKFGAISKQKKVTGATINVRDGKEDIDIEFSDYPTVPPT